jgi:putative transposase
MRLINEQYFKTPSWGSRSMRNHLRQLGFKINRKKVQRLMRLMGLEAIYPKPRTSRPHPHHKVYPYLLKNLKLKIDQGAQFTSDAFTCLLKDHEINISMDGR